jgi:hypothetical protein
MSSLKYFSLLGISLSFLVSCKYNLEKGIAPIARKVVPKMAITNDRPNEIAKLSEYLFLRVKLLILSLPKMFMNTNLTTPFFQTTPTKKDSSIFPRGRKCLTAPRE